MIWCSSYVFKTLCLCFDPGETGQVKKIWCQKNWRQGQTLTLMFRSFTKFMIFFNFFPLFKKTETFFSFHFFIWIFRNKNISVTFIKKMIFEKRPSYQKNLRISSKYSSFFLPLIYWNVVMSVRKRVKIMADSGIRNCQLRHPNHGDTRHTFHKNSTTLQTLTLRVVGSSRKRIKTKNSTTYVNYFPLERFFSKENIYRFHWKNRKVAYWTLKIHIFVNCCNVTWRKVFILIPFWIELRFI